MKESSMVSGRPRTLSLHWNNRCCFLPVWLDTLLWQMRLIQLVLITLTKHMELCGLLSLDNNTKKSSKAGRPWNMTSIRSLPPLRY
ncbi:hypothetical protein OIU85_020906 [Salix viminalis]|uniref:Uncharacterized protein n=1 Tax=Salix viminalis TaxID=40686 RepID=A0A6N2MGS3_SALVM|nr:hypothetical protein OIU85_020906 [Salix viminalis]